MVVNRGAAEGPFALSQPETVLDVPGRKPVDERAQGRAPCSKRAELELDEVHSGPGLMEDDDLEEILDQLTDSQSAFIRHHNIPLNKVFDAAGYSQADWREQMSIHEMTVAINVNPCRRAGHTMRTSGGHCVQCGPHNLAYQQRYRQEAYVYIAGSKAQRILKVGFSEGPRWRAEHLNAVRYGSAADWTLLFYVRCKRAGTVEHSLLLRHRSASVFGEYWKDRRFQECFELLRCDYAALRTTLGQILDQTTMADAWESKKAGQYDFKREPNVGR